jgi:hypothetical protein
MKTLRTPLLLALLTLLLVPVSALAQVGPGPDEAPGSDLSYDELVERFFATLAEEGGAEKALDDLYATTPYAESLQEALTGMKEQFGKFPTVMGALHGHERVTAKEITDRFAHVWELAYFDRQPLSFYFTFYRPKDRWQIYSMDYSGDLPALVKEMAREEMVEGAGR